MPTRLFTTCVLMAQVISAGLLSQSYAAAEPSNTQDQRPGHYVVRATANEAPCAALRDLLNRVPQRDLLKASAGGHAGFLRWRDTRFIESEIGTGPGRSSKSYWGAGWLSLPLEGAAEEQVLFTITTFDRYGHESQRLVLVPQGEATPTDGEQFRAFLRGRRHYSFVLSAEEIEDLKRMHRDAWELWSIRYRPFIYALEMLEATYLLAETAPISRPIPVKLLAFTLRADGERVDHCMLGKVAKCGGTKPLAELSAFERRLLTPAPKYCKR